MFNLDDVLEATEARGGGPTVVSEQHDAGQINWVNGLYDPGEMLACGYLPEARRRANETDAAYERRLVTTLPAGLIERIKRAALKRASLDVSNGRVSVMVAGQAPWHRLGVNVAAAVNSSQAMALANLAWSVSKRPMTYDHAGKALDQDEVFAIVRDDTGAFLGHVGSRYKPIQNADGFDFLDTILNEFDARYESAGALYGGRKVWMLVHLPQQRFAVGGRDVVEPYALFTNCHDGSGSAWCYPTTERVVCGNTFRVSLKDRDKGIAMRHTGSIKGRLDDAKAALGVTVRGFKGFAQAAEAMAAAKLPSAERYFNGVLDAVLDVTEAQAKLGADALAAALGVTEANLELKAKEFQRDIDKRQHLLEDIIGRYESERCGVGGIRGTVWSGFNAVTESCDYVNGKRHVGSEEAQASRKFESVIAGEADQVKQVAYEQALAYLPA